MTDNRVNLTNLDSTVSSINNNINSEATQRSNEDILLENEINTNIGDVSILRNDYNVARTDINTLRTDVNNLYGNVSNLDTTITNIQTQINNIPLYIDGGDASSRYNSYGNLDGGAANG